MNFSNDIFMPADNNKRIKPVSSLGIPDMSSPKAAEEAL
jgi:hypothetical protein